MATETMTIEDMTIEKMTICPDCHNAMLFAAYGVEMQHEDAERLKMAEDAIGGRPVCHDVDNYEEFDNAPCDLCWQGRGGTRHAWLVEVT